MRAAEVLGRISDPRAVEPLARAVRAARYSWDWEARRSACQALARIGDPAVEALIGLLGSPNDDIQEEAAEALAWTRDPRAVEPFSTIAASTGRPYSSVPYPLRRIVIQGLGNIGDRRAVPSLIIALGDHDWYVQTDAAAALGKLADPASVEPLCGLLKHPISNVRVWAADALGLIGDTRAIEPLLVAKDDYFEDVRSAAMTALWRLGYLQPTAASGDE